MKEQKQIVALTVDKIQTFLTQAIHSHVQEKQTEDATLSGIKQASYQISNGFFEQVQQTFPENDKDVLLACSGVYIFRCSLPEEEIEQRLNALFVQYYLKYYGQIQIRWTHFSEDERNNISSIQEAKKRLKQSKMWNPIIEKNKDVLFQFQEIKEEKFSDKEENLESFAKTINALYQKKEGEEEKNRFRIAVLKADLDGMGAMFKGIQDYETYQIISKILNCEISLRGLNQAASNCAPTGKKEWIFPFYIAGDDIFFAVAVEDLICGINVCRSIMESVNKKIRESGCQETLGISVGVEITINRQPIRYYMDMVEQQLKIAKSKSVPKVLRPFLLMKISIGNLTFFDVDYGKTKKNEKDKDLKRQMKNVPIWSYFQNDLKLLNCIRNSKDRCSELIGKPNFFYTLLQDIMDESVQNNPVRYMNHVLYHLFPKYWEDGDQKVREAEQILNYRLLLPLYQKNKQECKMVLNQETKQWFEGYLRLMILFGDVRFQIKNGNKEEKIQIKFESNKKMIVKYLFQKPRTYLYETCLVNQSEKLTKLLVIYVDNYHLKKAGYQQVRLDKSMLFRLRNVDVMTIERAAMMIKNANPFTEEEIKEFNEKKKQEEKISTHLYFDEKQFQTVAARTKAWNSDYIDSLMLFYQYHDKVMEIKKTEKEGRKQNGKSCKNRNKNTVQSDDRRNTRTL